VSRNKNKGTKFESDVVACLQVSGFPGAERRALAGNLDKGDILGVPDWALEAKDRARMDLGVWAAEAEIESRNAKASYWVVIHKFKYKPVRLAWASVPLWAGLALMGLTPDRTADCDAPKFRTQVARCVSAAGGPPPLEGDGPMTVWLPSGAQDAIGTISGWALDVRCHTGLTLPVWAKAAECRAGATPGKRWAVVHNRRLVPVQETYFTTSLEIWVAAVQAMKALVSS